MVLLHLDEFVSSRSIARSELENVKDNVKIKAYTERVIKCGDVIEVCKYENPVYRGYKSNSVGRVGYGSTTLEEKEKNRDAVLMRARKNIRNTVNCNFKAGLSKFLTLTFKENVTDIEKANYEFKKFKQRLEYMLKIKLNYTVVPETQKRGAIHFHVVCYNLPYVDVNKIAEVWGNGYIKLNRIDHVDNVGAYICKYLSKEEAEAFKGKKCYFNSRGLNKPIEITDKKKTSQLLAQLEGRDAKISKSYESDYRGKIEYMQYVGVSMN